MLIICAGSCFAAINLDLDTMEKIEASNKAMAEFEEAAKAGEKVSRFTGQKNCWTLVRGGFPPSRNTCNLNVAPLNWHLTTAGCLSSAEVLVLQVQGASSSFSDA